MEKKADIKMRLPKMYRLRQQFQRPMVSKIQTAIKHELTRLRLHETVMPGNKIGVTVGSRGIQNLPLILKTCVDFIREIGASPFLVSAMGSHGGGLEKGQKLVLDSLGITEVNLGAPVVTCAECRTIAKTTKDLPVFILESALELDGILVINRVKSHTSLRGDLESGLVKMLVVGLGGPKGAQQFHGFGHAELPRLLIEIGEVILDRLPIVGGIAIVENAYEETALIRAVSPADMIDKERELLLYSKSLMPSLPTDQIDLLIIQEMGKNFSGTGMDTNIIGRLRIQGLPDPEKPCIKRIAVLDLSDQSHGNAHGMGMADFVTRRLVEKVDWQATYLNCLTTTFVGRAAMPMRFNTEKDLLDAAITSLCDGSSRELRIVIIPNTLFLGECIVSETVRADLLDTEGMQFEKNPEEFAFDNEKRLLLRVP
ncbi:MAG: hypothetical protein M1511_02315 [Deltaproteobacteria bacterium]|nr:hypothetical protein [Deltaproteobacteria bacterium]